MTPSLRRDATLPPIVAKKPTRARTGRRPAQAADSAPDDGLNPKQRTFALEYLANGFNGTKAYQKAYPGSTYETAMANAYKLLRSTQIIEYLKPHLQTVWKARQMDGEEALARLAGAVAVDVRVFLDKDGNILPPKDWPDDAAQLIDSYEVERGKLKLVSKTVALRTILELTGKLKTLPDSIDALADAIKQDLEAHRTSSDDLKE